MAQPGRSCGESRGRHTAPYREGKAGATHVGYTIPAPSLCPRHTLTPCLGLALDLFSTHGKWCTFMKDELELEVSSNARIPT